MRRSARSRWGDFRKQTPAVTDIDLNATLDISDVSMSERLRRATRYLKKMPPATSGSGGHVATFKAAIALVRGFALPPDFALAVLKDEYNTRCKPPWSDKELRHKVDDAAKDGTTPLGALLKKKPVPETIVPTDTTTTETGSTTKKRFPCTDLGNAERLVHRHGEDLRYVAPWEKWIVWTGARWQIANKKQVERLAQTTVRSIYKEAADEADPDRRRVLAEHGKRSESNARKVAMIEQAKSLPGIPIVPDDLDNKPWLLNVQNGTIDLTTGELRDHRRDDMLTKMSGTSYDPSATCPLYDGFLARVLPDEHVREHVNRLDGYALTGVVREHVLPIHYGAGRNGKGVHANILLHIMGDYARQIPTEVLLTKRSDSHPTEKATLFGIRLGIAAETDENRAMNVAFVKQATGGDRISARRMREDFWDFDPTHKLQLSTNHRLVIRETKDAVWERVLLIPWTVKVPEAERDTKLTEKLKAEAPGILAKLVRACLAWQKDGLAIPAAVRVATENYRSEMDVLGKFIAEKCIVDEHAVEGATPLFTAFTEWAKANNEKETSQTAFGTALGERGFENKRDTKTGRSVWLGLRLRTAVPNEIGAVVDGQNVGTPEIATEEIERLLDHRPEGSEGSEPHFGFVPHESGIHTPNRKSLQTVQTLQADRATSRKDGTPIPTHDFSIASLKAWEKEIAEVCPMI